MKRAGAVCVLSCLAALGLRAQTFPTSNIASGKLAGVIPSVAGAVPFYYRYSGSARDVLQASDLTSPGQYSPVGNFGLLLQPLNTAIATQISSLPIASPASGFILKEDPATGLGIPAAQTLGPILTERGETIGRHKFYVGFTRQQFRFTKMDGQSLGNLSLMYKGGDPTGLLQGGKATLTSPELLGTQVAFHLDQNVIFLTYGLTNRIDVSAALPIVHASLGAVAFSPQIVNTGDASASNPGNCWCLQTLSVGQSLATFNPTAGQWGTGGFVLPGLRLTGSGSKSGIGDVLIRVKGSVLDTPHAVVAVGADLRTPSGDAQNYLGAGATGVKPFTAVSFYTSEIGRMVVAPHFNLGYQVNGSSILSQDPLTGQNHRLPDILSWAVGSEFAFARSATFVADFLSQRVMSAFRIESGSATGPGMSQPVSGILLSSGRESFNMNSFSIGTKAKVAGNLIATANLLIALDDNGLRERLVPLFGLSYTFGSR